jgi:hypothetical protein
MGAEVFIMKSKGETARQAFDEAVRRAAYDHGHSGYTGTIAEKDSFVMIDMPHGENAIDYANQLIDDRDDRIDDKWGPAGCIKTGEGEFLFFGWASC